MENKIFLKLCIGLLVSLFLAGIAQAGDILFHEEIGGKAVMYRISPDGNGLREIGHGLFPQWSPNKKFISYIGTESECMGDLVLTDPKEKRHHSIKGIKNKGSILCYSWNPKGTTISFVTIRGRHQGSVLLYDLENKHIDTLHTFDNKDLDEALLGTTLEWSPNGRQLLFSTGSLDPKGQGFILINSNDGSIDTLSDVGSKPRFLGEEQILFVIGSEIWTIESDGNNKKRLIDIGLPVLNASNAVHNKIILQVKENETSEEFPFKLLLLNIGTKRLEEKRAENYLLFAPKLSPEGDKFSAIGINAKNGTFISNDENSGYFTYDLKSNTVSLLKRFEPGKGQGFWFGVYFGSGNSTSWN